MPIAEMTEAVEIARERRHSRRLPCLGSGKSFDMEVRVGAGAYVCGEETALLNSLEGKRGVVRAKPPLPAHQGLFSCPTVINNVISPRVRPRDHRGQGRDLLPRFRHGPFARHHSVQIAGNVKHGGLYETAFGLSLGDIVDEIGGGTSERPPGEGRASRRTAGSLFPA